MRSFRDQRQAFTVSTTAFVDSPTLAITWPHRAEAQASELRMVNLRRWVGWMDVLGNADGIKKYLQQKTSTLIEMNRLLVNDK
jgi:hypothetical protein